MNEHQPAPQFLTGPGGRRLAYHHARGVEPTVIFLAGYASDMSGGKALHLESFCRARGIGFLRFDYSGHGVSAGRFVEGTIGDWTEDAVTVIEACARGPLLLVGSSMGAWIMLLVALRFGERVRGLVGIAAAPDFTEELMYRAFDEGQRERLLRDGEAYLHSDPVDDPYPVTLELIEEARAHLLLGAPIALDCPVRLMHGLADPDVPWSTSVRLCERIRSTDVKVTLIKGGGHRLSEPDHLRTLSSLVADLLGVASHQQADENDGTSRYLGAR